MMSVRITTNVANDALLGMESAKRGHLEGRRQELALYTSDSLDIPVVGGFRLSFGRTGALALPGPQSGCICRTWHTHNVPLDAAAQCPPAALGVNASRETAAWLRPRGRRGGPWPSRWWSRPTWTPGP